MRKQEALQQLHRSLDGRWRPEEVADLILAGFRDDLDQRGQVVLERAAKHSWRRQSWWSSMPDNFPRPAGAGRQLDTLAHLFMRDRAELAYAEDDPDALRLVAAGAGESIHWVAAHTDFLRDRLSRPARAAHGIDVPKRQYNRRFRFLVRLARKVERLEAELRKRELMLVGRSGLAADITAERFLADPAAACFVAYFTARRNLRRQFSLDGRANPYDEIAEVLHQRCLANPDADWWMISRVYPTPEVVARLSWQEKGELIGRWSALMRGAAEILARAWAPTIDRRTMIVKRGMDSSTWNTVAQAYNTARAGWINALAAAGALDLLDAACPGKVMRLMAADLAQWHRSSGSDVDPDTAVWAELPLPWLVLSGEAACTRETVEEMCRRYGVDAAKRGWTAPRQAGSVAVFEPTPELVHGVSVADPVWAALLRRAGVFSGKHIREECREAVVGGIPDGVVTSALPGEPAPAE